MSCQILLYEPPNYTHLPMWLIGAIPCEGCGRKWEVALNNWWEVGLAEGGLSVWWEMGVWPSKHVGFGRLASKTGGT